MRVLLADSLDPDAVAALTAAGHECVVQADASADSLPDLVAGFEVLVVRSTKVSAATIAAGDALRLVVRAGAGTNTIDISAATAAGVHVANVPGRNALAVAELAMGLMLAVDRRIPDNVIALREGRWDKKSFSKAGRGLYGATLGIVGLGSIGLAVAQRAKAFGMDLLALQRPTRSADAAARATDLGIKLRSSLPELAAEVEVLTLHIPSGADTAGVVSAEVIAALPDGATLINTSRGDVVDEAALLAALDAGRLWAGLDVYVDEPSAGQAEWTSRLAAHPRVVGTHHIGASTEQAQQAVAEGVVEVVSAYADGTLLNVVNPQAGAS
jgi:D-3-phosphoglycerate dehydrogenase / 2-oxoglutarate reductase